jgi:hypothetical protein
MKKGNDVAVFDDDDLVRTSVSQTEWQWCCILRNCFTGLSTVYIALSTYQAGKYVCGGGGKETDNQHNTKSGPSWVLHLPAGLSCDKTGLRSTQIFIQLFCDWASLTFLVGSIFFVLGMDNPSQPVLQSICLVHLSIFATQTFLRQTH